MWRYLKAVFLAGAMLAGAGCGLLHHGSSPQQQFLAAVQSGNSAKASEIWLHMDADDRANFAHGVGFQPLVPPAELKAELARKQKAAEAETADSNGGDFTSSSETTEYPGVNPDLFAGSLQNLPNLINSESHAAAPVQ